MGTGAVYILIGAVIAAGLAMNLLAIRRDNNTRELICFEHNRKVMLGRNGKDYDMASDIYLPEESLRMHNSGTVGEGYREDVEFISFASPEEYYL